jgi:molybdenum cofactor cytidylyltransferase
VKLADAFAVRRGDVVSFVGAGGKTSTLLALGKELADAGWRVLATTTTRLAADQLNLFPEALPADVPRASLVRALDEKRFICLYHDIEQGKALGIPPELVSQFLDDADADVMLVEADGARGLHFKAPRLHEPVIPAETTLAVPTVSIGVLGQPLNEAHVMGAGLIHDAFGFPLDEPVKSPWVAQVLRDPAFGLKGVPPGARVVGWVNQVPPTGYMLGRARMIASLMLRQPRISAAAFGSAQAPNPVHEARSRVGAVILAAGMSTRMQGEMKVLLPWQGQRTILEHLIQRLYDAKVDDVVVVTGHRAPEVKAAAERMGARVTHNPRYASGEMLSSLQAGLSALGAGVSAAMVVLGDQPRLNPPILRQVMETYFGGSALIVAPSYQHRRGHPILIDRRLWPELLALPDGSAPRDVINRHADQTAYVVTTDDGVVNDVDTPQAYREERRRAGLGDG